MAALANKTYRVDWSQDGRRLLKSANFTDYGGATTFGAARAFFVNKVNEFETFVQLVGTDNEGCEQVLATFDLEGWKV